MYTAVVLKCLPFLHAEVQFFKLTVTLEHDVASCNQINPAVKLVSVSDTSLIGLTQSEFVDSGRVKGLTKRIKDNTQRTHK